MTDRPRVDIDVEELERSHTLGGTQNDHFGKELGRFLQS